VETLYDIIKLHCLYFCMVLKNNHFCIFFQLKNWCQSSMVKIRKRLQNDLAMIPFRLIILFELSTVCKIPRRGKRQQLQRGLALLTPYGWWCACACGRLLFPEQLQNSKFWSLFGRFGSKVVVPHH